MAAIKNRLNLWIALGLIFANLFVWARLLLAVSNPHVVDPIMDPIGSYKMMRSVPRGVVAGSYGTST